MCLNQRQLGHVFCRKVLSHHRSMETSIVLYIDGKIWMMSISNQGWTTHVNYIDATL